MGQLLSNQMNWELYTCLEKIGCIHNAIEILARTQSVDRQSIEE